MGKQFTITNQTTGAAQIYQFECGVDVTLPAYNTASQAPAPEGVRNGNDFTLNDGTNTDTFQFISGPVLTISAAMLANIANMTDGDTFTITNTRHSRSASPSRSTPAATARRTLKRYFRSIFPSLPALYSAGHPQCDHCGDQWGGGVRRYASYFIDANGDGRISLLDGRSLMRALAHGGHRRQRQHDRGRARPWPVGTPLPPACRYPPARFASITRRPSR